MTDQDRWLVSSWLSVRGRLGSGNPFIGDLKSARHA
jgi:hypothetical protein